MVQRIDRNLLGKKFGKLVVVESAGRLGREKGCRVSPEELSTITGIKKDTLLYRRRKGLPLLAPVKNVGQQKRDGMAILLRRGLPR